MVIWSVARFSFGSEQQQVWACAHVCLSDSSLLCRGHEHECCADPVESVEGQYFVLQPGSSVATSLSGGESVEKKVVIMEIKQDQYRTVPVPLHTTRPFIMADVKLADELDALDATPQIIEEFLTDKVMQLIANAKRQFRGTSQLCECIRFVRSTPLFVCVCISGDPRYMNPDRPDLPLVRVRVDHTGFPRIVNVNKFGQKFVGKVANPEELLLFSKQKAQATKSGAETHSIAFSTQLPPPLLFPNLLWLIAFCVCVALCQAKASIRKWTRSSWMLFFTQIAGTRFPRFTSWFVC